jgi:hypothetical protein
MQTPRGDPDCEVSPTLAARFVANVAIARNPQVYDSIYVFNPQRAARRAAMAVRTSVRANNA